MYKLLILGYLLIAVVIIVLVLIQRGKGADMGSSFGAGASATLFGSSGSGNFLTRSTTILGVLFFILSIVLSNLGSRSAINSSDEFTNFDDIPPATTQQNTGETAPTTDPVIQPESVNPTSDIPE
ncbi:MULTISPECIES: preprotein translocase subunit SecG [unclassified Gilliamella]|uniref:preprotein translocase subunit SecG n=1 Tax=unclassified Gilliamella TaxID=2685620 RepID=UPI001C6A6834|nr:MULTISPECIES: preprotein translocase subunit SecG [unclassified Gilliamella]MCX8600359.1 preprotein translocase subunit SecG [Gilliamella sp. B3722]MCX8609355.1 preprotein translocase subunit SecG [Gilliamella sp. B3771]MCX8609574.1 preprotein translocase subunit SecG [Gilliamella sp. B3891]MCX8612337.1 preprotein translocase subunit SecG [Gilliamella sp. B3773]MCX8615757.1 preprotein translocase subunit SecG [Gilliamella sp. B3770]